MGLGKYPINLDFIIKSIQKLQSYTIKSTYEKYSKKLKPSKLFEIFAFKHLIIYGKIQVGVIGPVWTFFVH
jgi:hypothetical protein